MRASTPTTFTVSDPGSTPKPSGLYVGTNGVLWYYSGLRWWQIAASAPETFPLDAPVHTSGVSEKVLYVNTDVPAGNTIADTTDETAFDSSLMMRSDTIGDGSVMRIRLFGVYGTTGTPTLTIKLKLEGTIIATTGAVTMPAAQTDSGWSAEFLIVGHVVGGYEVQGTFAYETAATTSAVVHTSNADEILVPFASEDTSLTVTADWSAASASNTITLRTMLVEALA